MTQALFYFFLVIGPSTGDDPSTLARFKTMEECRTTQATTPPCSSLHGQSRNEATSSVHAEGKDTMTTPHDVPSWRGTVKTEVCAYCGREFDHVLGKPGRPRIFCSRTHQLAAYRWAQKHPAEPDQADPDGG